MRGTLKSSRNTRFSAAIALLLATLLLPAGLGPALNSQDADLKSKLTRRLEKSEGSKGVAALMVVDIASGDLVYSRNADKPLIPASNMKLLTTIAAVNKLGSDFEFTTKVLSRGTINQGVLTGDLCLVGGGDPNISGRFHDDDPLALYRDWALQLKKAGITTVTGDLLFDATLFGDDAFCEDWPKDDQYIKWYCAEISALSFNDNCVGLKVLPASAGKAAKLELIPETAFASLVNEAKTEKGKSAARIGILRPRDGNEITVKGTVYEKATWGYSTDVAVHNPALYAATVFKETLAAEGITVRGKAKAFTLTAEELGEFTTRVEHRSLLARALGPINTNSQNLHAELLFRQLGVKLAGKGTFKTSRTAMHEFLKSQELPAKGVVVTDGSGLARSNRLTARLLVELLRSAAGREDFEVFRESLAVSGESGTLKKRMTGASLKGKVRAKTGYISGVRALSGYLELEDRRLAFSLLFNNCKDTVKAQQELLEALAAEFGK